MRRRVTVVGTLAAVLTAASSLSAAQAAGPGAVDAPSGPRAGSEAVLPANLVLRGRLLRNGVPRAGEVLLLAWPNDKTLTSMRVGARFATAVVFKGRTGSDGRFGVPLDPGALPAQYVGPRGQVDLQVVAADATTQVDWFMSAVRAERASLPVGVPRRVGWTTQTALRADSTGPEQVTLDLGAGTADTVSDPVARQVGPDGHALGTVQQSAGAAGSDPVPKTLAVSPRNAAVLARPLATTVAGRGSVPALPAEVCQNYVLRDVRNRPEVFARVFAWKGAKGIVDLNDDSDHQLGVAVASSGKWSSSGTKKISTSAGATVKNVVDAQALNKVNYRDYGNTCYPSTSVWRRPLSFYALIPGREFRYAGHVKYKYCNPYAPGQSLWKKHGRNTTYSAGVDAGPINVSAQSGWNTETKISWDITKNTQICGSSSKGWVQSASLDARAG